MPSLHLTKSMPIGVTSDMARASCPAPLAITGTVASSRSHSNLSPSPCPPGSGSGGPVFRDFSRASSYLPTNSCAPRIPLLSDSVNVGEDWQDSALCFIWISHSTFLRLEISNSSLFTSETTSPLIASSLHLMSTEKFA